MSSTASKVADIFTAAGAAFNRLGELTVQLHPLTNNEGATQTGQVRSPQLFSKLKKVPFFLTASVLLSWTNAHQTGSGKWGDEEIEMLRSAVNKFGEDLKNISEIIKTKSITQIKSALKQRMYEQSMVQTSSPKKAQKRPAGQADGVKTKKPKEQGQDGVVDDDKVKSSPFKEAENDVDIESIFDDVSGQNASIQRLDPVDSEVPSEILSSDLASP